MIPMKEYVAEFVGTALLILLGNGVVANVALAKTKGNNAGWIVITFGWPWRCSSVSGASERSAARILIRR